MGILKNRFYNLKSILNKNATYSIIIGERSNGKTYAVLKYGLEQYVKTGGQMAIIRRWQDDFKGKRAATMFDALIDNGEIVTLTEGEWTSVFYYAARWYFSRWDEEQNKRIVSEEPFAYAFALSSMEHDKSTSYPKITTILFDEFLTRGTYLPDEFVLFMNVISTIVRHRSNVKIFMCANTVSFYAPYIKEMGLQNIRNMKQGTIDVYTYGDSSLRVAVEYCSNTSKSKESNDYFAFNNPKLQMITGGSWELDIYPHLPCKYLPKEVLFTFFIVFEDDILQCEIINHDGSVFIYIHRKTGEIKNPDRDLVYSIEYDPRPNWKRRINKPDTLLTKKIAFLFAQDKIFYQDNEVGEVVRNYIQVSNQ